MRYMFDTNICIHLIQQRPAPLLERCERLEHGEVVLSAIVLAELRHGVERDPAVREVAQAALERLLTFFPVLPFDEAAASAYGVQRAAAPNRRRDALDRLIAAHASSLDLTLVTRNEADFAGYPGLKVEDWVSADA